MFDIANLVIADHEDNHQPTPDTWRIEDDPANGEGLVASLH